MLAFENQPKAEIEKRDAELALFLVAHTQLTFKLVSITCLSRVCQRGFYVDAFLRLVHGNSNRYDSPRLLGLKAFPVIKPSTSRVLLGLLALGVASVVLDSVVLAPLALARPLTSAIELRVLRSLVELM